MYLIMGQKTLTPPDKNTTQTQDRRTEVLIHTSDETQDGNRPSLQTYLDLSCMIGSHTLYSRPTNLIELLHC